MAGFHGEVFHGETELFELFAFFGDLADLVEPVEAFFGVVGLEAAHVVFHKLDIEAADFAFVCGERGLGEEFDMRQSLAMKTQNKITEAVPPNHVFQTRAIDRPLLEMETDLEIRFLGNDLNEICECAAERSTPVLIATAGLPLANRLEAVAAWRSQMVARTLANSELAKAHLNSLPSDQAGSLQAGKIKLAQWRAEIEIWAVDKLAQETLDRRCVKGELRGILRGLIRDVEDKHLDTVEPRWALLLPDGEFSLWRYEQRARNYAKKKGLSFFLLAFDPGRSVIRWNPDGCTGAAHVDDLIHKPALGMSSEEIEDLENPDFEESDPKG